jgi:hypothetical protein
MSPIVAILLGSGLVMEAASLRTAPKPVISREQFRDAAKSLKGLMNGTLFLCSVTTESTKTGSAKKTGNPHIIGDGTPLPLEKLNWEVEDFNPEALMDSPCGIKTEGPERVGGGKMAVPQKQLIGAIKLWYTEITKDAPGDFAAACKKMDTNTDKEIDEKEFDDWIDKTPFDARVKTPEGEIMDAMFDIMKEKDEAYFKLDTCEKDMKKFDKMFNTAR